MKNRNHQPFEHSQRSASNRNSCSRIVYAWENRWKKSGVTCRCCCWSTLHDRCAIDVCIMGSTIIYVVQINQKLRKWLEVRKVNTERCDFFLARSDDRRCYNSNQYGFYFYRDHFADRKLIEKSKLPHRTSGEKIYLLYILAISLFPY